MMHDYKIDLYKTAIVFLKDEEEALEAIQEVTYRAYKNIHGLREAAYAKTWLIRIMINYCNDRLKDKKKVFANESAIYSKPVYETHWEMELKDAMLGLDDRSREILTLKYFHDIKIKDIAIMMERPEGTVKTWLNKALKSLREKLEDKGGSFYV